MSIIYAAKEFSKVFIPDSLLLLYHRSLASIGAALYGYPSRKMVVIGVTGTKGKTTVVHFIADMLMQAGKKVGFVTGVSFRIGDKVWPNTMKMTMPGRFTLQKVLKQMVESGCAYAIVETTSEGIRQHRHRGIDYDIVALTNISPEHIESHGSYEEYREAKAKLFASLSESYRKTIGGKQVEKVKVLNYDDPERGFFEKFY